MTSGNLQRWISPFPWNLNKKEDCQTYQGSWSTGVEYYSMCISLVFGSLNDVVGNIKSSIGLCALIWIVKATLAANRLQQRKTDATHPTDCETDQWIFDQRKIASYEGFSAEISYFLQAHKKWRNCICIWHKHMHNEWNVLKCITYILYV